VADPLNLLILPGDGIGPEIAASAAAVVEAAAAATQTQVRLTEAAIGFAALETEGTTLPDRVVAAAKAADGVILGPVSTFEYPPKAEGGINPSGALRKGLELYANIRPALSRPGAPTPLGKPVDLIIARENLEGFYADRNMHLGIGEFMPEPGIAMSMRKITAKGSRRIAEAAFRLAAGRPRRRVTIVHKANVMHMTDGLFLREVRAVAERHPDVAVDDLIVDAAAALLVRDPGRFDVIVTTNMFGDILSDLASELAGGLGLAASINVGDSHVVAQAQHGSAPDIAGQDRANPASLIGSAAMMLRHLGAAPAADAIEAALDACLADPARRTRDLGGALGTKDFTAAMVAAISDGRP
jgi:isocitrate/isopropylmalate dehydrogenase